MVWGGLNRALTSWRNGINARLAGRDTRTDGARADKAHGSSSQHQEDSDGTVDAYDSDINYLNSGVAGGSRDEDLIAEALKLDFEADYRSQLWIHNREIANRDIGNWRERHYDGDSPHTEHIHFQSRQSTEDDGSPWKFAHLDALLRRMNGDDMEPKDLLDYDGVPNLYSDKAENKNITVRNALKAAVSVDVKLDRVEEKLNALTAEINALIARLAPKQ